MNTPTKRFFLPHKKDPRQWKHQRAFGAIHPTILPETLHRYPQAVFNQGSTGFCTAYAAAGAMTFKLKFPVSPEYQTAKEGEILGKPILQGTNMDTPCKVIHTYGCVAKSSVKLLLAKDGAIKVSDWKNYPKRLDEEAKTYKQWGYYDAHTGKYDAFDNIRGAIYNAKQAGDDIGVMMGTPWYDEFNVAAMNNSIMPMPKTKSI